MKVNSPDQPIRPAINSILPSISRLYSNHWIQSINVNVHTLTHAINSQLNLSHHPIHLFHSSIALRLPCCSSALLVDRRLHVSLALLLLRRRRCSSPPLLFTEQKKTNLWYLESKDSAPLHQMQQYYRLGGLDNCSGKWNALVDCLTLKTKRTSVVEEILETREKAKPHIWSFRTPEEAASHWKELFGNLDEVE